MQVLQDRVRLTWFSLLLLLGERLAAAAAAVSKNKTIERVCVSFMTKKRPFLSVFSENNGPSLLLMLQLKVLLLKQKFSISHSRYLYAIQVSCTYLDDSSFFLCLCPWACYFCRLLLILLTNRNLCFKKA